MKSTFFKILFASLILANCAKNDQDDDGITIVDPPAEINTEINDFIWKGLNQWYYWQEDVPNLADTRDDNAAAYKTFLSSLDQGEEFFNSLLYKYQSTASRSSSKTTSSKISSLIAVLDSPNIFLF